MVMYTLLFYTGIQIVVPLPAAIRHRLGKSPLLFRKPRPHFVLQLLCHPDDPLMATLGGNEVVAADVELSDANESGDLQAATNLACQG